MIVTCQEINEEEVVEKVAKAVMQTKKRMAEKANKVTKKVKCPVEVTEEKLVKVPKIEYEVKMMEEEVVEMVPETKMVEVVTYNTELV